MELPPGTEVDRYVIEELLGRGGMAAVYRVRHRELGGLFALKVLDLPSRSVRERLRAEGTFQSTLRHPNVVAVTDVLTLDGVPALVLEYVNGPTLEALLGAHRPTIAQQDALARGILLGVRAAHRHGLVHRDLKPANILLQRTDDGFVPKIADFGLARVVAGDAPSVSQTRTGSVLGTPAYMAPEQFQTAKVDVRADVYALGVTLYELCTGHRPYAAHDLFQLLDEIRRADFLPPRALAPELPERMERAILGALRVNPDERFPDVDALYSAWVGGAAPSRDEAPAWDHSLLDSMSRSAAPSTGSGARGDTARTSAGATFVAEAPSVVISSAVAPARPPSLSRRAAPFVAVAGLGLALLVGVGVTGVSVGSLRGRGAEPSAAPAAQAPAEGASERAARPAAPAPVPAAAPSPARRPARAPDPDRRPGAGEPPPPPPPPPPAGDAPAGPATWSVEGDAVRVVMVGADGREYAPGRVEPGRYEVRATFTGSTAAASLWVEVGDGEAAVIRCSAASRSCKVR